MQTLRNPSVMLLPLAFPVRLSHLWCLYILGLSFLFQGCLLWQLTRLGFTQLSLAGRSFSVNVFCHVALNVEISPSITSRIGNPWKVGCSIKCNLLPHCWTMLQIAWEAVYHQHWRQGWAPWPSPLKPDTDNSLLRLLSCRLFSGPFQASLVSSQLFPRARLFSAICGDLLWFCQWIVLLCRTTIWFEKCMKRQC